VPQVLQLAQVSPPVRLLGAQRVQAALAAQVSPARVGAGQQALGVPRVVEPAVVAEQPGAIAE
jgi:hypothetical protein